MLNKVITHLRDREYMSGIDRDKNRIKATGEVFTPTPLVHEVLSHISNDLYKDSKKTFLDPTCGDGQFLSEVVIKKMEHGSTYEEALSTTYGADIMEDNCIECIQRLYGVSKIVFPFPLTGKSIPKNWRNPDGSIPSGLIAVFEVDGEICKIVQADGLLYDFHFDDISARRKEAQDKIKLTKKKKTIKTKANKKKLAKRKSKIKPTMVQEVNT